MSDEDINKQAERFAGVVAEQLDNKLAVLIENLDSRIDRHVAPLRTDMGIVKDDIQVLKLAVKDTNTDLRSLKQELKETNKHVKSLDKALGNVEYKIHDLWRGQPFLRELDQRVGKLEKLVPGHA